MKPYGIIYKAINKTNGKVYIGQTTKSLKHRMKNHISRAFTYNGDTYFHNALRSYGIDAFEWEIVAECFSLDELNECEKRTIEKYNSYTDGYNLTIGGDGTKKIRPEWHPRFGKKTCEKTRLKIKAAQLGEKGYWYKKEFSGDHRNNLSRSLKGKRKSKRHAENISKAFGNFWLIKYPNGVYKIIQSLAKFCRENKLNRPHMSEVSLGKRKHCKHFKCKKLNEEIIVFRIGKGAL